MNIFKRHKFITGGIVAAIVLFVVIGVFAPASDEDTVSTNTVAVAATEVPEPTAEPEAGVDYPTFDTVEELRADIATRLTAWGLEPVEAECVANGLTILDMRFTLLSILEDISADGSLLPREIVALPSWLECVS